MSRGTILPKLTKKIVDALLPDPGGADVFIWDTDLRGFGIRMKPSRNASYLVQYRTPEGRTRRKVIAKVGTLTPDEARKLAREDLAAVASGSDPSTERKQARKALTVGELCDLYLEAAKAGLVTSRFNRPKRPSTIGFDGGRIERHIKPLIGNEIASKLTSTKVQRMLDDIAVGRTAGNFKTGPRGLARVGGGIGTARRVVELLGGIWTWAEKRGHVSGPNPARKPDAAKGAAKDRTLSIEEIVSLGKVLRAEKDKQPAAVAALRLVALTGLRRDEATSLRWREVDLNGSCLRLEQSKTGKSQRAIGNAAVDHLKTLLPEEGKPAPEFLFPASRGKGSADLAKRIAALFDLAGLSDARAHDLRRTFASIAADEGYGDATIGELLGHARRGVTAVHYIRRPDAALIAAADRVSTRIATALDRKENPAQVRQFPDRADEAGEQRA